MSREQPLTVVERDFILEALHENVRLDGRGVDDLRPLQISFGEGYGHVKVSLGCTSLAVQISAGVTKPRDDRPSDGLFFIAVELTAMGSPAWENLRQGDLESYVNRILDRVIRHSNALDTESLCILKGKSCWEIRADVHVTDYDGNLIDCACIGVLAGLQHFRRPDVEVKEGRVTVFGSDERVPVPLSITHKPLAITFHTFDEGKILLLDATLKEEQAAEGDMVIALNSSGEICAFYKASGCVINARDVIHKLSIALQKVQDLNGRIAKALETDLAKKERQNRGTESRAENDR